MNLALISMDVLWRNALAAVPLAILVALACRCLPCRPATRHAMWLIVLLSLAFPPLSSSTELSRYLSQWQASIAPIEQPAPPVSMPPSGLPLRPARADYSQSPAATSELWHHVVQSPLLASRLREMLVEGERTTSSPARFEQSPAESRSIDATAPLAMQSPDPGPSVTVLRDSMASISPPFIAEAPTIELTTISSADSSRARVSDESISPSVASVQWQQWLAGVLALRDAIVRLAPVPTTLWLGGCVVIVLVLATRTIRFRRITNRAVIAPRGIRREVERASRKIGLRTPPQTYVTDARISPMVWCGFRRVLLLPSSLWEDLDATGRDAVLLHELAHVRRRDHWVRWIELLIGCVYWWHPVVWFVRKRLRDEADFCCDAWVTALLPTSRGAYARALVATRQYISESSVATPAVGLGITTNRTKRFARRLTMVMTNRSGPRLSGIGASMTMCLALAAWLAAPLWACPPDEKTNVAPVKAKVAVGTGGRVKVAGPEDSDATTFEKHMAEREAALAHAPRAPQPPQPPRLRTAGVPAQGGGDVNERLNRLEERLNRMTEHLERMMHQQHGPSSGLHVPHPPQPSPPVPPAPPAPPVPGQPGAHAGTLRGAIASTAPRALIELRAQEQDGQLITRVYRLPEGKCAALYELMARSDVPVRVARAGADSISVEATAQQHEVFGGFVALVHPEGGRQHGEARARETVALGRALAAPRALRVGDLDRARVEFDSQLKARTKHVETIRRSMAGQKAALEKQIETLHRRARELEQKARELEKQSSKLETEAENSGDEGQRQRLIGQAHALATQAQQFEAQAQEQEQQVEYIEDVLDSLEDQLADVLASLEDDFADFASEFDIDIDEATLEAALAQEEIAALIEEAANEAAKAAAEDIEPEINEE